MLLHMYVAKLIEGHDLRFRRPSYMDSTPCQVIELGSWVTEDTSLTVPLSTLMYKSAI